MFLTPKETAEAVYEEFGVKITGQNAEKYDYTRQAGTPFAHVVTHHLLLGGSELLRRPWDPVSERLVGLDLGSESCPPIAAQRRQQVGYGLCLASRQKVGYGLCLASRQIETQKT